MGCLTQAPEQGAPWRVLAVEDRLEDTFRNNNRFKCIRGKEFLDVFGALNFPDEQPWKRTLEYQTKLGRFVDHNGLYYKKSNNNLNKASSRMLNVRKAEKVGYDSWLRNNQITYFRKVGYSFSAALRELYRPKFDSYMGWFEELEQHYADPHKNRELRIHAHDTIMQEGIFLREHFVTQQQWSFKTKENAKMNKHGRIYVSLGPESSLQGFRLMTYIKKAQETKIHIHGGTIQFINGPRRSHLRRAFSLLRAPPRRFYCAIFSDDSCLSVNTPQGVKKYNLDLSGCDSSHGPLMFEAFAQSFPEDLQDEVRRLFKQAMANCHIRAASDATLKVIWKVLCLYLPSGIVCTTALNTFAVALLVALIMSREFKGENSIIFGAEQLGYIMTIEECELDEDLQFLKHSPAVDITGRYQPLLNPGVIIRSSGTVWGDLDGSGSLQARADAFQHAFLQGMATYVSYPLVDNMKKSVENAGNSKLKKQYDRQNPYAKVVDDEKTILTFTSDSIFKRYRLSYVEMEIVDEEFGNLGFGEHMGHPALSKILLKDYGLECI